jgi:two-component system sensor histidine kinase BaeS
MKIFPKLFITFSASFIVVIAMMIGFISWNISERFSGYVRQLEMETLEVYATVFEDYYGEVRTWRFIKSDPRIANIILNPRGRFDENVITSRAIEPFGYEKEYRFYFDGIEKKQNSRKKNTKKIKPNMLPGRLILLDKNNEVIVGIKDFPENSINAPINYKNKQIGTLTLIPARFLSKEEDLRFQEATRSTLYSVGAIALVIAALISLLLTLNFTGPVRKLARATKGLIGGEFKTRVNIKNKDELGKLSRDFNVLAKTLDKNAESQKQWLADISHELRTPLAILKSELEAIEDGVREFDQEAHKSLSSEVNRLSTLVNDLYELTLSDIGAMRYQMDEVDLKEILNKAIESYIERFKSQGIELKIEINESITILGDELRLTQLFTNLLENSLRYTDSPGVIEISLITLNNNAEITFSDSSPGVKQSSIDKIFDRFYREELSRSREKGGAGLGLAICAEIIDAHSGTIKASPSDLNGLRIIMEFNKVD